MKLPGDKSIAHRALLFAALADGPSVITNLPTGDDVARTIAALELLGTGLVVEGLRCSIAPAPWRTPATAIDCGNSGTLARLLLGALAGEGVAAALVGDASLTGRPMGRVQRPLRALFGDDVVELASGGTLPARVHPRPLPTGAPSVDTQGPSAQVKSALVLAARRFPRGARIHEAVPTRDHTERLLRALGAGLDVTRVGDGVELAWSAPLRWRGFELELPGDPSSAALVAAYAAVTGRALVVDNVLANPLRIAFFKRLASMGAEVAWTSPSTVLGEERARLVVRGQVTRPVTVEAGEMPSIVDEVPALVAAAACVAGVTTFRGIAELRVKESDRAARLVDMVRAFGGRAGADDDTLEVTGPVEPAAGPVEVRTDGDHRIAMAATVLARACGAAVRLDAPDACSTSFPGFTDWLDAVDAGAATS